MSIGDALSFLFIGLLMILVIVLFRGEPDLVDSIQQEVQCLTEGTADNYRWMISQGVAKECARVFLPEGLTMSRLYVSGTLRSWLHYLDVRDDEGVTQHEHVLLARKIKEVLEPVFPKVFEAVE